MTQRRNDIEFQNRVVRIPIEDSIDLHTFQPKEIPSLLKEYLSECQKKECWKFESSMGKGRGSEDDRSFFPRKKPLVDSYETAPLEAGAWGATLVYLKRSD